MSEAWRATSDGLRIAVRLTPKGGRDDIDGLETLSDGRTIIKARVRAAPENNEANQALIALFAKMLGVSKSMVALETGATSRLKTLAIQGPADVLAARLSALCSGKDRP
ncbi:DUF167 domain-containing protein [Rhizobiales bacterium TNE-4]|nr:DUF167 domain-containing protein [Rhizobiales bacterium TNE-4]MBV1828242.1 DUF167 domain-containing protein [Rhizobiales bacterium TNE-4]